MTILSKINQTLRKRTIVSSSSFSSMRQDEDTVAPLLFRRWTLRQMSRLLSQGWITSEQLCQYCYYMATAGEEIWQLHAFERIMPWEDLREQAQQSDHRRRHGRPSTHKAPWSVLEGIPISIKANIAVDTQPLTAGSRILGAGALSHPPPAIGYHAEIMQHLVQNQGALVLGMTTQDEFGMGSLGHSVLQPALAAARSSSSPPLSSTLPSSSPSSPSLWVATKNPLSFLLSQPSTEPTNKSLIQQHHHHYHQRSFLSDEEAAELVRLPREVIIQAHERVMERYQVVQEEWHHLRQQDQQRQQQEINPAQYLENHSSSDHRPSYYHSAGGSSCGGAASVAHGSTLLSVGTDTGGSVRLPAAWCGVTGFKPSYGRLSRHGLVAYASSLDTVGFLAPTADCLATLWPTLVAQSPEAGREGATREDFRDSTQSRCPPTAQVDPNNHQDETCSPASLAAHMRIEPLDQVPRNDDQESGSGGSLQSTPWHASTSSSSYLSGWTVGIPAAMVASECPEDVAQAWARAAELLTQQGATVRHVTTQELSPEVVQASLAAYYVLATAEASSNLARYDGFRYGVAAPVDLDQLVATDHAEGPSPTTTSSRWSLLERQYAATRTQGFGGEVIRRILCGTFVLSADQFHTHYESAAKLRAILTQQLHQVLLEKVDLLLVPTSLFPPPLLPDVAATWADRMRRTGDYVDSTHMMANDVMTVPFSLAGLPAVAVPVEAPTGASWIPSMQLVAGRHREAQLLTAASQLQSAYRAYS